MPLAALGLRGSGSYSAAERPQSWREMILALFPNGKAPLTALLSKLRSEPVDDPIFNWFEKDVPVQRVLCTASFTNVATTLTVADSTPFRGGHVIMDELTNEKMLVTVDPPSGTTLTVQRGFGTTAAVASSGTADPLLIIGNVNAEGAAVPSVVYYSPTNPFNYTQIFRTPLYLTRTALKTRLRTGNAPDRRPPGHYGEVRLMLEDPKILRLNILHYQELLKLERHTAETRARLIELLAEAQAQLPFASAAAVSSGNRWW